MSGNMPGGVVVDSIEIGQPPIDPCERVSWVMRVAKATCDELDELLEFKPPATHTYTDALMLWVGDTNDHLLLRGELRLRNTDDAIMVQFRLHRMVQRLQGQMRTGTSEHEQPLIVSVSDSRSDFLELCHYLHYHCRRSAIMFPKVFSEMFPFGRIRHSLGRVKERKIL